ncbi:MAG: hypothetical protein QOF02_3808 [Blastocatellia bacterium]|jgi:hypothetical protein|nr:hypothetical protein [Blastocatellia bacterium]
MSYLVICTFDLKNASREDYLNAYVDLEKIGLKKVVVSSQGNKIVMPTTTTTGEFSGASAAAVRDRVIEQVKNAFAARRFSSEIYLAVGADWAWGARTT